MWRGNVDSRVKGVAEIMQQNEEECKGKKEMSVVNFNSI
jgi:hypothetical protein